MEPERPIISRYDRVYAEGGEFFGASPRRAARAWLDRGSLERQESPGANPAKRHALSAQGDKALGKVDHRRYAHSPADEGTCGFRLGDIETVAQRTHQAYFGSDRRCRQPSCTRADDTINKVKLYPPIDITSARNADGPAKQRLCVEQLCLVEFGQGLRRPVHLVKILRFAKTPALKLDELARLTGGKTPHAQHYPPMLIAYPAVAQYPRRIHTSCPGLDIIHPTPAIHNLRGILRYPITQNKHTILSKRSESKGL